MDQTRKACTVVLFDPIIIYNDSVELALPVVVNGKITKDEYGKMKREYKQVSAHVRYHLKNYYNERGEGRTSEAQVYIPYDDITKLIDINTRIKHTDPSSQDFERAVQKIDYGQDVIGNTSFIKVYL